MVVLGGKLVYVCWLCYPPNYMFFIAIHPSLHAPETKLGVLLSDKRGDIVYNGLKLKTTKSCHFMGVESIVGEFTNQSLGTRSYGDLAG